MNAPDGGFWRARLRSFVFAWRGLVTLVRTQGNARIHLAATAAVIIAGLLLKITTGEWAALALAAGLVWAAEGFNTALEILADRISSERDERIGRVKDIAAGAVLLAAIAAAITGACILGPRLWALI